MEIMHSYTALGIIKVLNAAIEAGSARVAAMARTSTPADKLMDEAEMNGRLIWARDTLMRLAVAGVKVEPAKEAA